jgi:hypothetical protein
MNERHHTDIMVVEVDEFSQHGMSGPYLAARYWIWRAVV